MIIKELKENQPLEIIEASKQLNNRALNKNNSDKIEFKKVQMKIFTDGEILKEGQEINKEINGYVIGKSEYDVNILKTKNIYLKDYSYVLVYLIANEYTQFGNVLSWFDVVKDVSIYLKNMEDKKSLKKAKKAIKIIKNKNIVNNSSIFNIVFAKNNEREKFPIEKNTESVYTLSKKRVNKYNKKN